MKSYSGVQSSVVRPHLCQLLQSPVSLHCVVPPGPDSNLVPGGQVTELPRHLAAAQTLRPAVRHAVLAVQTEQTVVAAGAAVVAAALQTASVVSRTVLQTGGQAQVLLVSQAALAPRLAVGPQTRQPPPLWPGLAAVLTLRQHVDQLAVDQGGQRHARVRVPQPGGGRGAGGRLKQQTVNRGSQSS